MDREFWLTMWDEQTIGFHQPDGQPLLHSHWPAMGIDPASRVCVPLCGKARDMAWLAARGHQVTGIELSEQAARDFFTESGQDYQIDTHAGLRRYHGGPVEILVGDLFELPAALFGDFAAVYDRAALIALPPDLRRRYVEHLYGNLPACARALLICLTYEPGSMEGPPFSVDADEVRRLLPAGASVQQLERRPLPGDAPLTERGARGLVNTVYRIGVEML